jgi:serine protease Do
MTRAMSIGIGVLSLLGAGLVIDAPALRAAEKPQVRVVRTGGGAFLGVLLQDVGAKDLSRLELNQARGALVEKVESGSPAEKAGVAKGDVIVGFDGETVRSAAELSRLVRETPPGREVSIEVSRQGSSKQLTATVEQRPGGAFAHRFRMEAPDLQAGEGESPQPLQPLLPEAGKGHWPGFPDNLHDFVYRFGRGPAKLGITFLELTDQLALYFKVDEGGGVLVTEVTEEGPASQAGMKAGDVILKLAGKRIESGRDLRRGVDAAEPGSTVEIDVLRAGQPQTLSVTIGGEKEEAAPKGPIT